MSERNHVIQVWIPKIVAQWIQQYQTEIGTPTRNAAVIELIRQGFNLPVPQNYRSDHYTRGTPRERWNLYVPTPVLKQIDVFKNQHQRPNRAVVIVELIHRAWTHLQTQSN
jgi:hypothetical protein